MEPASLRLQWADRHQTSVILTVPFPTATQLPQHKGLDLDQLALLVCTAHNRCPWRIAIAQLAAPISTMANALQPMDSSHQFLPCLLTTKALPIWYLGARPIRLMEFLQGNPRTLRRIQVILAVATMDRAQLRNFPTIQLGALTCVVLSILAHVQSHLFHAQAVPLPRLHQEHLCRPTSRHQLNSRSRFTHHPLPRSSLLWSP